ncbi:FAD-binding oxidoreductase [Pontibacter beigongshangensis]|uniref:FAD-binding oxidoreductase n=1 Tax=Pontibacter beigongshangensis TaxID=2574733 RepID=UPI00164F2FE4|nr:FAD-binding oxidoreductase [Pontibacter beigongshangensis]
MSTYALRMLGGGTTELSKKDVIQFAANLRGELFTPDSPDYDQLRTVWNGMVNRKPALIIRCAGVADIMHAVAFARRHRLLVSVRGGGHNIAGSAVCDGGLMIDLSHMRSVRIDPLRKTARVEPGCTLADFDHEAQAFGLATPVGINSTTGIAGLTLGGGFGWLSRKYGLTVDNLLSADIVTADSQLVTVSKDSHADLFWAIRGGGGNFGVITSFEYELHPVGPEVLSGLIVHPFQDAKKVMQFYRQFTASLPDEAVVWAVLRKAPPLPFLPQEWHGKEVVVLAVFYEGDASVGKAVLDPLRAFGNPIADVVGPHPYAGWQQAFDPLLTAGARNYWKSHNFSELSDEALDVLIDYASQLPSPHTEIFVAQVGGQVSRVGKQETPYPHRDANYILNVHARWEDPSEDDLCTAWARAFFRDSTPFAMGGVYVNFLTQEETDRIQAAYGPNLDRLVEIKGRYDAGNLFRSNQNIKPGTFA